MKSKLLAMFAFIPLIFFGQSIAPLNTDVYCLATNLVFTFTAPGSYSSANVSVYLGGGTIISQSHSNASGVSVVTATIRFADANTTQAIRFSYGAVDYYIFNFQKIKSLYIGDAASTPAPNLSSIPAKPCEIETFPLSFTKVSYVNVSENPKIIFGTLDYYQYSLPTGWSLNGGTAATSTTDYKTGTNSVTITSDISNGVGGYVAVRAINNCGSTLFYGPWQAIPVIRAKPPLTFQSVSTICSSAVFQANNVPSWVSAYQWAVNPGTSFTFSNVNANSNPTTISNNGSTVADISLVISNSTCPLNFTYNTAEILNGATKLIGGTPRVTTGLQLYSGIGSENGVCFNVDTYIPCVTEGYTSYPNWSYVSNVGSPQPSWNGTDQDIAILFFRTQQTSLVLQLDASNTCGTSTYQFGFAPITCASPTQAPSNYNISPNPTTGIIRITKKSTRLSSAPSKTTDDFRIVKVEVYDFNNTLRMTNTYDYASGVSLNLGNLHSGNYIIVISNPGGKETQQVILR